MSPPPSEALDLDRLLEETFVRSVEQREEVGSTNDLALELAASAAIDLPLLVVASRQTAGRGRGAARWWASEGALTFSLLVDTEAQKLDPRDWPRVSLEAGLAIARTLDGILPQRDVRAKWPNDVFIDRRKVCGILVENSPAARGRLVIGVGLNVNNSLAAAPRDVRDRATSLVELAGRRFDRTEVLVRVLTSLAGGLAAPRAAREPLRDRWQPYCMLAGHTVHVQAGSQTVAGICQGIDDQGALLLATADGLQRCVSGVITHID